MKSLPAEYSWIVEEIENAFEQAVGKWSGCDNHTTFGRLKLDLKDITSSQALLLARATSGQESADWQAAVRFLEKAEQAARSAEMEGVRPSVWRKQVAWTKPSNMPVWLATSKEHIIRNCSGYPFINSSNWLRQEPAK